MIICNQTACLFNLTGIQLTAEKRKIRNCRKKYPHQMLNDCGLLFYKNETTLFLPVQDADLKGIPQIKTSKIRCYLDKILLCLPLFLSLSSPSSSQEELSFPACCSPFYPKTMHFKYLLVKSKFGFLTPKDRYMVSVLEWRWI